MRASYFGQGIIRAESGEFVGFCLGYDHCAEHEWGIDGIIHSFGIPRYNRKLFGIPKRIITKSVDDKLKLITDVATKHTNDNFGKIDILLFSPHDSQINLQYYLDQLPLTHLSPNRTSINFDKKIATAWNENSFAIAVSVLNHSAYLKELHDAFLKKDVSVGLYDQKNSLNDFGLTMSSELDPLSGLTILIVSKVPKNVKDLMRDTDKKSEKIITEFEKTRIENTLKKAGKKYFALSPSSIDDEQKKQKGTKYNILCWLNPSNQHENNFGWYTIEELEMWANDGGPIPMREQ